MAVVKGISENQGARMFHVMMIIPAGVLLLLLSLISLGYMASANKKVNDKLADLDQDEGCILYSKIKDDELKPNEGAECKLAVWGGAVLAILAVALSIVLGVKTFFGIAVFSFLSIIELGVSALGAVWALIVAVVITAGLDATCKSYREELGVGDHIPCCVFSFVGTSEELEDAYFFYEDINTSGFTAWFAMGLLFCLAILYGIIFIIFCCRAARVRRRGGNVAFTELPESAAE